MLQYVYLSVPLNLNTGNTHKAELRVTMKPFRISGNLAC
jgi:hypothetical protein